MADVPKLTTTVDAINDFLLSDLAHPVALFGAGVNGATVASAGLCPPDLPTLHRLGAACASVLLLRAAMTMLSICGEPCREFDPVAFGKAAEALARDAIPHFVQTTEAQGKTRQ